MDGLEIRVVGTPGHTSDSLSFLLPAEGVVLTGDTVLGRGTTVVAHPDGQLGAYLDSWTACTPSPPPTRWAPSGPATARSSATRWAPSTSTSPTVASVWSRSRRRSPGSWPTTPRASPPTSCPAASWRSSTPTSTRSLWGAAELSVRAQLAYLSAR
ncbi:MBL fold metallo-hydrolase [Nocardioides ungokensis]|uniref:MBL fold metallo-hydrolase n=1 Tax=Nocardioides ungokensis TaxID=1643322 RepID=UPI0031B5EAB4